MCVDMSEWLRRQTRNLLGSACAGSNPAVDDFNFFICYFSIFFISNKNPALSEFSERPVSTVMRKKTTTIYLKCVFNIFYSYC
jgi:hypothetical protein